MTSRLQALFAEAREILKLGLPLIGAQLAQMSMFFADVAMLGHLDKESLASMSVGHSSFSFFFAFGIGVCAAVNPLVAQAFGAGRRHELSDTVRRGLWVALMIGLAAMAALSQVRHLFVALGHPATLIELGTIYVTTVSWCLVPALCFNVLKNALDAVSRPQAAFRITVLAALLNVVLNRILIFGALGLPGLGIRGAALATVMVSLLEVSLALWIIHRCDEFEDLTELFIFPGWSKLWSVLSVGLPIGVTIGAECGFFVVGALMMGRLGVAESAAHQIALTCAATAFMIPLGLSLAASVRVGQLTGAERHAEARLAGWVTMVLALVFMSASASLFLSFPQVFLSVFMEVDHTDPQVLAMATQLLFLAAVFALFDGLQITATGALRGLKDVKVPMAIVVVSFWVFGFAASGWLGFFTPLRHQGIWIGFVVGLGVAGLSLATRFWHQTRGEAASAPV